MGDRKLVQYIDELTDKEKIMIKKILLNYDFKIHDIDKVRNAYKVNTNEGPVCLKKLKHNKTKVINSSNLVEELEKDGFYYATKFFKTKDSYLFVKHKKMFFYVTEWIDGEECDLNDITEACTCAKLLANFHVATNKINVKRLKLKNNIKNWPRIFNNNLADLEKYKKILEKKRIKNDFDIQYENYIDSFYSRGAASLQMLNSSDYYSLSKDASERKTICHDSFYYQNILKQNDEYYIIDLDSIIIDLQINDLGKLIRRLMFKKEYQWDFNKARALIEAYNEISNLKKSELEAMLSVIVFPHKFWKLGRKRYIKHKDWSENKYLNKLNKLIRYDDLQKKFLEDYIAYVNEYKDLLPVD